jgi:catechol 2,3-dioxygenase-like lactoylglutathione lyase family enzyme
MPGKIIFGIQQVGIGVENAEEAFHWYASRLGAKTPIFDDWNTATYMAPYMGGETHKKRAILSMNLHGGSGYEIWQYLDRKPAGPVQPLQLGDLGIFSVTVKTNSVENAYRSLQAQQAEILSPILEAPDGHRMFFIKDPYNNILQIKESHSWYKRKDHPFGGVSGCAIGVRDIDQALRLYYDILHYDDIVYDKTGKFDELSCLPGGNGHFRRVLLKQKITHTGGFALLFGESRLELVQALDRKPNKIFENRYWGDLGYIHLCFDIKNMPNLVQECAEKGFPFRVLSNEKFDMGNTSGHWGYIEDLDGTLVEFVETKKLPIFEKFHIFFNVGKRDPMKPVPKWLIKGMAMSKLKKNKNYSTAG